MSRLYRTSSSDAAQAVTAKKRTALTASAHVILSEAKTRDVILSEAKNLVWSIETWLQKDRLSILHVLFERKCRRREDAEVCVSRWWRRREINAAPLIPTLSA